jgi:hypothetical protein
VDGLSWSVFQRSLITAVLVLALFACGGAQAQSPSPAAQETASIQTRLASGPWRLADYRPNVSLEPMLAAMLSQQVRTMVVHLDGRTLSAQSPTLQVTRPYLVENVTGLAFDLVSPNPQGGGYLRSRCQMSDDGRRITFYAQTEPWTGSGVIEREGP